jgi:AcrR family transcriptional regulator
MVTAGKGEQTRAAILSAAVRRFGRDGYRSTSVADIARDADVGGTVAYAYFANKEELFLAALDQDAAGVIDEGTSEVLGAPIGSSWQTNLIFTLVDAVEQHPLARRVLSGLEPDVTRRITDIPAMNELRKTVAERLRSDQAAGFVRTDIDPVAVASGCVSIMMSLMMTVLQLGREGAELYGNDVLAVFTAALEPPKGTARRRS